MKKMIYGIGLIVLISLLLMGCAVKEAAPVGMTPADQNVVGTADTAVSEQEQEVDAGLDEVEEINQLSQEDISFEELETTDLG